MFKIVAFDMDGTIADTIPMCIKAFHNSISPYTDHMNRCTMRLQMYFPEY